MERLILHVGPSKTGTTAIQGMLARNRAALARSGVCYPAVPGDDGLEGHPTLAWEILEQLGRKTVRLTASQLNWSEALRQADESQAHTLLISAEDFTLDEFDDAAIALLREYRGAQELVVIYGLRDPRRLIPSMWQQAVKWGLGRGEERLDLADALPALVERYRRSSELYLGRSTAALASATLRPFIVPVSRGPDLCHRFLAAAGLDHELLDSPALQAQANESIGYPQLQILLELNRLAPIQVAPLDQDALLAREFIIRQLQETEAPAGAIPIAPQLEAGLADLRTH